MYVATTARYLGDPMAASGMPQPSPARLAELSKTCAKQWKSYGKKKGKNFPHVWRAFLAANPSCRAGVAIRWGYQPSLSPCADANTGLLIDCWDAALQKGVTLNGLGAQLTQAQLSAVSKAYGNMSHAQQVALRNPRGYYFNGQTMVRSRQPLRTLGRLGQDDLTDWALDPAYENVATMPITPAGPIITNSGLPYSTPIDTSSGAPYSSDVLDNGPSITSAGPDPLSAAWWNQITGSSPTSANPSVTPPGSASQIGTAIASLLSKLSSPGSQPGQAQQVPAAKASLISGVPNVILYGGAAILVLMLLTGNRRR